MSDSRRPVNQRQKNVSIIHEVNQQTTTTRQPAAKTGPHFGVPESVTFCRGNTVWTAEAALVSALFDDGGLRLDEWEQSERMEFIKDGSHRSVSLLHLPCGRFYLKHYKTPDTRALLQNIVRPCKALLESRAAAQVAAAGIRTLQTIAVGQQKSGPLVRDNYLITRAIEDVEPLDRFMETSFRQIEPGRQTTVRQQLASALGELIGRLSRNRLLHRDLHAGNVLIGIDSAGRLRLWLIDLHAVSRRRIFASRKATENLWMLRNFFDGYATASDRLRFFRSYRRVIGDSSAFRSAAQSIDTLSHKKTLRAYRKIDRKWSQGNRRMTIADTGVADCRGDAGLDPSFLLAARDDPQRQFFDISLRSWSRRSEPHRVAVVAIDVGGKRVSCCCEAVVASRKIGGRSQVRHAWEMGHALLRRNIGTARPLMFVSGRSPKEPCQYLLTEEIPNAVQFDVFSEMFLPGMPLAMRECWLRRYGYRLAQQLRRMRDCRLDHRNLAAETILVSDDSGNCRLWFLSLAAVRSYVWFGPTRAARSLARLDMSLQSNPWIRHTHRLRFLKRYLGTDDRRKWKQLWKRIQRQSQGIRKHDGLCSNHGAL